MSIIPRNVRQEDIMRQLKILILIFALALSLPSLSFSQKEIQSRIIAIESLLNADLSPWKFKEGDISKGERSDLDDSGWDLLKTGETIRSKVSWLRRLFKVPEAFAGAKTEGSKISLLCRFQGVGKIEGQFFRNSELKESFALEFGNMRSEIEKEFLLSAKATPSEKLFIAFRFDNLGKLPLTKREDTEPGTFLRLREARFSIESTREAEKLLLEFLLDLKTGFSLLDFETKDEPLPPRLLRPVSKDYQKLCSSNEFQTLRRQFEKSVLSFDLEALRQGNLAKVKDSLAKFYEETEPIALFSKSRTIAISGNSHIDLAWLWRWAETVEVTKETFLTIMDNMEEYPEIIYVQSQAQAYKWMEERHPHVFEQIKKKVAEGRWEIVGGMWAEPDCNLIDGESLIRQILYGKRYFKEKFGVDVKIGWVPDSFGYNFNIPQFLRKSGFDSFITQKISWNETNAFPYFLFWWQGVDGSRILTYFPPTGYVGTLEGLEMVEGLKHFERNTGQKNVLLLYGLGNHGGGPNREMLNRGRDLIKQKLFPRIRHSSVSDYLSQLHKKNLKNLPVWNDELYLEYHRGTYTTQAETKRFNRKSETLLSNAEKLSSLALLFGRNYPQQDLKQAWEKVLMNQFHDILPGSSINPVYRDAKESYLEAQRLARDVLLESLRDISLKIQTESPQKGTPLLVFNPLAWERDGIVRVSPPQKFQEGIKVLDEKDNEVPCQILTSNKKGKELTFLARKIPALGYKVYRIQKVSSVPSYPISLKVSQTALENQYFQVTLNPETGNIISIFDKLQKKEIVAPAASANQLQLLEDIPDEYDAWNIQYTGRHWELDKAEKIEIGEEGPVMASLRVKKTYLGLSKARREPASDFPSSFFSQEIILYNGLPRIDVLMNIDWWEDHVLLKVAFPVDVKGKKATFEIPFASIQRPTTRTTDWDRARYEVPAIRWADLSDGEYGVSLLNESKYGYDVKDNVIRLTLLRSPLSPDPMADRGKHRFSYALYPHKGDWREGDTVQRGLEFNSPLLTLFLDPHPGELPPSFSFFKASPSNIILATLKKAEDRESLILRLYESEGKASEAAIKLFRKPKKVYELDLMENRLHSLPLKEDPLSLKFEKYEIKTLELAF